MPGGARSGLSASAPSVLGQHLDGVGVAAGVVPTDVGVLVGSEGGLMDVRAALAEQGPQVGGHEVPTEEVLLTAVTAVDGDPVDALRGERGAELGEFGEVGQDVGPFVVGQWLHGFGV